MRASLSARLGQEKPHELEIKNSTAWEVGSMALSSASVMGSMGDDVAADRGPLREVRLAELRLPAGV
jgi:hypothetical protein